MKPGLRIKLVLSVLCITSVLYLLAGVSYVKAIRGNAVEPLALFDNIFGGLLLGGDRE